MKVLIVFATLIASSCATYYYPYGAASNYGYHYQYPSASVVSVDPWSYASATHHQSYQHPPLLNNPYLYGAALAVPQAPTAPQIQYQLLQPQIPQIQPLSLPPPQKGSKGKPNQAVPPAPGQQRHITKTNKNEDQVQEQIQEQQQQQETDEQQVQQHDSDVPPQQQQNETPDETPVKGRPATKGKNELTKGGVKEEQPAVKGESTKEAPEKKGANKPKKEAAPSQDGDSAGNRDDANRSVVKDEKKEGDDGFTRRKRAAKLI